jgi:hypothetical protein
VLTEADCSATQDWYKWIEGEVCDPNPCPPPGICCICHEDTGTAECIIVTEEDCMNEGGGAAWSFWFGPALDCGGISCHGFCWSPIETTTWGKIRAVYR